MKIKDFFKLSWPIFILFVLFNYLDLTLGFYSIFSIFDFFSQLSCATPWTSLCLVWDPFLMYLIPLLNIIWQFFLANLVIIIYNQGLKKKNE